MSDVSANVLVPIRRHTPYLNLRRYVARNVNDVRNMLLDTERDTIVVDSPLNVTADLSFTGPTAKRFIQEPKGQFVLQTGAVAANSATGADGRVAKAPIWVETPGTRLELHGETILQAGNWSGGASKMLVFARGAHGSVFKMGGDIWGAFNGVTLVDCDDIAVYDPRALFDTTSPNATVELMGCRRARLFNLYGEGMEEVLDMNTNNFDCDFYGITGKNIIQYVVEMNNSRGNRARGIEAYNCKPLTIFDYPASPGTQYGWSLRYNSIDHGGGNKAEFTCHLDSGFVTANQDLCIIEETFDWEVEGLFRIVSPGAAPRRAFHSQKGEAYGAGHYTSRRGRNTAKLRVMSDTAFGSNVITLNHPGCVDLHPIVEAPITTGSAVLVAAGSNYDAAIPCNVTIHNPTIIGSGGTGTGITVSAGLTGDVGIVGQETYSGLATDTTLAPSVYRTAKKTLRGTRGSFNPASLAANTEEYVVGGDVTVTGVAPGTHVITAVEFSDRTTANWEYVKWWGIITATDTVKIFRRNSNGSAVDLASGTITVYAEPIKAGL